MEIRGTVVTIRVFIMRVDCKSKLDIVKAIGALQEKGMIKKAQLKKTMRITKYLLVFKIFNRFNKSMYCFGKELYPQWW